jgi:hypothetical protein
MTTDSRETSIERITEVRPYEGGERWSREAGFQIVTTAQTITLAIDDEASCCESWGYFLTEDDTDKFVGAALLGVEITDTNRSNRTFPTGWDYDDGENVEPLDEGDVMFVDLKTDRGVLQFVAYNAHNGYYGHTARVSSTQVTEERTL